MAQTTWKGGSGVFNTPSLWTSGVPGTNDQGFIDGSDSAPIIVNVAAPTVGPNLFTVAELSLYDATLLVSTGTIVVGSIVTGDDTTLGTQLTELNVTGGKLTVQQDSVIGSFTNTQIIGLVQTAGTVVFQNGSLSSGESVVQGEQQGVSLSKGATLEVDAGTLEILGNSNIAGTLASASTGPGTTGLVLLGGGATYDLAATTTLNVNELAITGAGSILSLGGTLSESYRFAEFAGSTIDLNGWAFTIAKGAIADIGGVLDTSGTLVNSGSIDDSGMTLQTFTVFDNKNTVDQHSGIVLGGNGTKLENDSGATYSVDTDGSAAITGSGTIVNTGTFEKITGAGATVATLFNSTGTVLVTDAILNFANNDTFGGKIGGSGEVELSGGGSDTLNSGVLLTVTALYISAANEVNELQVSVLGSLAYGGVFTQDATTDIQLLSGGKANPELKLTNSSDQIGGTFTGDAAALLLLDSTAQALSDNNLIVRGAMTVEDAGLVNQGGTVTIGQFSGDKPQLEIDAAATYSFNATSLINGDGTITNNGTFVQTAAVTARSIVSTYVTSETNGSVISNGGVLEFTGSDVFHGTLTGTAAIALSGAAFTLEPGVIITVSTLEITGDAGAAQVSVLQSLADAEVFDLASATTLDLLNYVTVNSKNVTITTDTFLTLSGVSSINGVVTGQAGSELVWSTGASGGDGGMVVTGAVDLLDEQYVGQQGLVVIGEFPSDTNVMTITSPAIYNLTAVSTIDGDGHISNFGTFEQSAAVTGISDVAINMTSTGTILSNGGVLELTGGDILSGYIGGIGTVAFSGASFLILASTTLAAATLEITDSIADASVTLAGGETYAGSWQQTAGTTLALAAGITLQLSDAGDFLNGSVGGVGSTLFMAKTGVASDSGLTLTGTTTLEVAGRVGQGGTVSIGPNGGDKPEILVDAGGTYDLTFQSFIVGDGTISNNGTFEQDYGVTNRSIVETYFKSTGLVLVSGGTLEFTGGGDLAGTIAGSGELQFSDGAFTLEPLSSITITNIDISANVAPASLTFKGSQTFGGLLEEEQSNTISLAAGVVLSLTDGGQMLTGILNGQGIGSKLVLSSDNNADAGLSLTGAATFEVSGYVGQSGTDSIGVGASDSHSRLLIDATGEYNFRAPSVLNGSGTIIDYGVFGQGAGGSINNLVTTQFTSEAKSIVVCDSGAIEFNGTDYFAGAIEGTGTISLSGSTFTFAKGLVVTVNSLDLASDIGPALLDLQGSLAYAGSLTQASNSTITIAAGATLTLSGGTDILDGTVTGASTSRLVFGLTTSSTDDGLTLGGGVILADTGFVGQSTTVTLGAQSGDGPTLQIATAGIYDLENSGTINGSGNSHINNLGLFEKTGNPGNSTIAPAFTNDPGANLTVSSGLLVFNQAVTNDATATVSSGGTIQFNGAVLSQGTNATTKKPNVGSIVIGTLGTVFFENAVASSQTVSFTDLSGRMVLTDPSLFSGIISGFSGTTSQSDTIDVTTVNYNTNDSFTYVPLTSNSGELNITTLVNGETTTLAQLHFTGSYSTKSFLESADASGNGTNIIDPPATAKITPANTATGSFTFTNTGTATQTALLAPTGIETLTGFALNGHDVLDLARVLAGASGHPTLANLGSYITASDAGGNTTLAYDPTGGGHGAAFATLDGIATNMAALLSHHAFSLG